MHLQIQRTKMKIEIEAIITSASTQMPMPLKLLEAEVLQSVGGCNDHKEELYLLGKHQRHLYVGCQKSASNANMCVSDAGRLRK
jgi:hypothetical protein